MFPRIGLRWRGVAWKHLFWISSVLNLLKYLLVSDKRKLYCKYHKYKWNWLYCFGEQRIYLLNNVYNSKHIEVFYIPDITVIYFSSRKTYNAIRIKVFNITFFNLK